jgi:hypothetical protein
VNNNLLLSIATCTIEGTLTEHFIAMCFKEN